MGGIGETFERSVEHQRDPHQRDGKNLDSNRSAEQDLRKSLHLVFGLSFHLSRSTAGDEDDAARRFLRVGVDAGGEVLGIGHDYCASFAVAALSLAACARTVPGSLACE